MDSPEKDKKAPLWNKWRSKAIQYVINSFNIMQDFLKLKKFLYLFQMEICCKSRQKQIKFFGLL